MKCALDAAAAATLGLLPAAHRNRDAAELDRIKLVFIRRLEIEQSPGAPALFEIAGEEGIFGRDRRAQGPGVASGPLITEIDGVRISSFDVYDTISSCGSPRHRLPTFSDRL
jgi:hypothetical protein